MRLIDAEALKNSIDEHVYLVHHGFNETEYGCTQYGIHQIIDEAPTIDAEPVRHGKWKNDCMGVLRCSECNTQASWKYGRDFIDYRWKANYCPYCGTKMLNATALTKDARKDIDEEIERAWEYAKTD